MKLININLALEFEDGRTDLKEEIEKPAVEHSLGPIWDCYTFAKKVFVEEKNNI